MQRNHVFSFAGWQITILIGLALFLFASVAVYQPVNARPLMQGGDVIAQVNALRAANGLPPYKVNSALMAAAQAHSDWQAATGNTSHTGEGGSGPSGRAIAFGYGDGAKVSVTENIASGMSMTPAIAVEMWQGDSLHLTTMISPDYTDAGAGVASDGRVTYITLDVGYLSGQAGSGASAAQATPVAQPGSGTVQPTAGSSGTKGFVIMPVATVTPQADGSIIHIVQPGEVLLNIALAYNVKLSDVYKLNFLNDKSVIFPGQKIKIKGPDPTATPTATATPTRIPTATRRPTRTPTPTATRTSVGAAASMTPLAPVQAEGGPDYLLIAIGALLVLGIGLVSVGFVLKRR